LAASPPPIVESVTVSAPRERAFAAFHGGFGRWWPAAYSYAGESGLQEIRLGLAAGDLCSEIGPAGFQVDWGRMLAVEAPGRLAFLWQIAPDRTPQPAPARASEIEVIFEPEGDGTKVTLTHRAFERCGAHGGRYRDEMASPAGWPRILQAYKAYADGA
jgi:uncharacterized protein YndB with AHSA1/START domain